MSAFWRQNWWVFLGRGLHLCTSSSLLSDFVLVCILDILSMSWPSSEPNLITHSRLKPWICWHIHALINDLLVKKWFVFQLFTVVQRKISLSFYVCSLQWFQVRFTFETNGLVIDGPWILVKKRLQIHICQTIN